MTDEIYEALKKIAPELLRLLGERHPDLVEVYQHRLNYALGPYPEHMRIHNALEIFRIYIALKEEEAKIK